MFGDYQLVRSLGRGGMAETWEAKRSGPRGLVQRVALKRVLPELLQGSEIERARYLKWFEREARITANLSHPAITAVLDCGSVEEIPYLALEYVDGVTLGRLIRDSARRGEPIPEPLLVNLAFEVGSALCYAHERGSIHRDVTPDNILLSAAGEVKLTDFGIAKMEGDTEKVTRTGAFIGKLPYVAPEVLQAARPDARTDLYSFGVSLIEAALGEGLFECQSPPHAIRMRLSLDIQQLLQDRQPALGETLVSVLTRLTEFDREKRFGSAAEALLAIEGCLSAGAHDIELKKLVERVREGTPARTEADSAKKTGLDGPVEPVGTAQVMEARRPLVHKIVRDLLGQLGSDLSGRLREDLMAEGMLALLQAYRRYDPENEWGASFATFAYQRIRGQILDAVWRLQGVPPRAREKAKELAAEAREEAHPECDASLQLNEAYLTEQWVYRMQNESGAVAAPRAITSPERALERKRIAEQIETLEDTRQRAVLTRIYTEGKSGVQIAKELGLGRPQVAKAHKAGLRALKEKTKGTE